MSGHSHWSTIKHKKGAADAKRGKLFSKLSKAITIAAKNGIDPEMNPNLRVAIDQAKKANMPNDNIEKAIKRGDSETQGEILEEFIFEAYGPEKSAVIITGITDNKNRALNEIKIILNQHNAKMAQEGSVKWQFDNKGIITIRAENKEEIELKAIEAGAEDIQEQEDNILEIYTKPEDLNKVKEKLNIEPESTILGWVAKEEIEVKNEQAIEKLFEALDDNDDVQEIYSNVKF
jgi:YebC/PmpR family DNA-binding regulatory protein